MKHVLAMWVLVEATMLANQPHELAEFHSRIGCLTAKFMHDAEGRSTNCFYDSTRFADVDPLYKAGQ